MAGGVAAVVVPSTTLVSATDGPAAVKASPASEPAPATQPRLAFSDALQTESTGPIAGSQSEVADPALPVAEASSNESLVMALVALGSAQTDAEVDASVQRIESLGLPAVATSTPTPSPTAAAPECVDSESHPAFCVYTVQAGDTLSAIAGRLGLDGTDAVSAVDLLVQSNKPDVVSSDHIEPGQNLRIPQETGIIHTVITPESLDSLASAYGITADAIEASRFNDIPDGKLALGQNVFIPDPQQVPSDAAAAATETATPTPELTDTPTPTPTPPPTDTPAPTSTPKPKATAKPATATPTKTPIPPTATATKSATATPTPSSGKRPSTNQGLYAWPVIGPISSYFGPSHPLGIDIDLFQNNDAPIKASRSGIVTFAGGDPCCSYGYYVIIDHGDNQQTLYAHLSAIGVKVGQSVAQGDVIGIGGRTGYATGYHLHFELHIDGQVVDPLLYLPPDPASYGN